MSKSADLKARKAAAVPNGVGNKGIYVAKAENAELWDVDGRRFIDFAAGIAVVNTGHRHPGVMAAVKAQARQTRSKLDNVTILIVMYRRPTSPTPKS